MNVGEIRLVDDSIGRLIKLSDTTVIFLCLSFPYFRSMRTIDAAKCKRLAASLDDFQTMLDLPANNVWTLSAWKNEMKRLLQSVIEEYEDNLDDEDGSTAKHKDMVLRSAIRSQMADSDWVSDPIGQEKLIQYSVNYLDVTPELINKFLDAKDAHRFQSVRKASAMAHMMVDLHHDAKMRLKNNLSDY